MVTASAVAAIAPVYPISYPVIHMVPLAGVKVAVALSRPLGPPPAQITVAPFGTPGISAINAEIDVASEDNEMLLVFSV